MRYSYKRTFNMDLRRAPKPANCFCPNCDKELKHVELLNKACNKCGYIFFTNIHGEPIVFTIPHGEEIKEVSGHIKYRHYEAMPMKDKVYKDGALCPHCDHKLMIQEMQAQYCKCCYNSFHVTPAGEPMIVEIYKDKDIASRININYK